MLAIAAAGVVFLALFVVTAVAVAAAWALLQRRARRLAGVSPARFLELEGSPVLLKQEALSTISLWARLLARFDFVQQIKRSTSEAGLTWSVGRITLSMLLIWSVALAALGSLDWLPGLLALIGAGILGHLPYFYILRVRAARLIRFEEQFPEALDYLARALRAGHPFAAALEMLSGESAPPLSTEMRKTFDEHQLGMSWEQALDNLAVRVPTPDVSFFAAAVLLQSRTGGRLGEVLGRLAETMRERASLRGEIRAISTHGRLTGLVLTLIPIVVAGVMMLVNPAYLQILITNPYGKDLLLAAGMCLVAAHLVIRHIVNVKL